MSRRKRDHRTKQQLIERANTIGPLLQAALVARETTTTKQAELEQLVADELAPVRAAEQEAYQQLYEASLHQTKKGLEPEELVVTLGKGKDKRKVRMLPTRTEVKKKNGRTVVKEQETDEAGNPLVDGNDEPIMVPVILRVEFGLKVIEEEQQPEIEISL